jgi:hypothetical protein
VERKKNKATKSKSKGIDSIFAKGTVIDEALVQGVQEALRRHKQAGLPVVEWRDGKPVWVPAERIELRECAGERRAKSRRRGCAGEE